MIALFCVFNYLFIYFCSCHALTSPHHPHCHPLPPSFPSPLSLAVYLGLCGSDCGAPLQEFGSGRCLESCPTLSPIQRPARCEVGKFHSAIQVQWPPQKRLQAPAHSCRDLGAAQVQGGSRGRVEGPRGCSPSERRLHGNGTVPRPHITKVVGCGVSGVEERTLEFSWRDGIH